MIGYCPIEFDEPSPPPEKRRIVTKKEPVIVDENTECNYVVMFFIVGVIALAAMDAVKK
jgi:hypothetical protein